MRNLTIRSRATLVFLFLTSVLVLISFMGINSQKNINDQIDLIEHNYMPAALSLADARNHLNRLTIYRAENFIDAYNSRELRHTRIFAEEFASLKEIEAKLDKMILSAAAREIFANYLTAKNQLEKEVTEINRLLQVGNLDQAAQLSLQAADASSNQAINNLAKLVEAAFARLNESATESKNIYHQGIYTSVGVLLVVLVITILLALAFIRSLTSPINYAVQIARTIANNDLTQKITLSGKDEATQMLMALKTMQENLAEKVGAIINSATQLAASAEELSVVTNQTSEGVQSQRMETEQVATAMNEMTATVHEVAQNSEQAAAATSTATKEAQQGEANLVRAVTTINSLTQEVEAAGEAIDKLSQDAQEINTVLVVINDIAEQTNLLALNAAIEAARAGEAGRGFAVVADEVRNLAQRTQESTSQIEGLIANLQAGSSNAVNQMQTSRNLASETSVLASEIQQELEAITAAIQGVQDMGSQIATAAEEQSSVAEEINESIIRVNDIADQSAAAVEETSTAASELARLGQELQSLVSQYKV